MNGVVLLKRGFPRIVEISFDPRSGVKQSSAYGRSSCVHPHEDGLVGRSQVLDTSKSQPEGSVMAEERRPNNACQTQAMFKSVLAEFTL